MPESAQSKPSRPRFKRSFLAVLLLLLVIATLAAAFTSKIDISNLHFGLGPAGFGSFEERDSVEGVDMDDGSVSGSYVTIIKGFRLGALRVFMVAPESDVIPPTIR